MKPGPYRPHLPHPRAYWAFAVARVRLVGAPLNPEVEQVVEVVEVVELPTVQAADWLQAFAPLDADLVRLAAAKGLVGPAVS